MAENTNPGEPLLLVDARRRLPIFRFVQVVILAVSAVLSFAAHDSLRTGDGAGVMWQGVLAAALLLALVVAMLGGIVLLGLRYVARMTWHGDDVRIETVTPWGRRVLQARVGEVRLGAVYAPVVVTETQRVNAPGQMMRLDGWRLPFLIDLQAEKLDHRALNRLSARARRRHQGSSG